MSFGYPYPYLPPSRYQRRNTFFGFAPPPPPYTPKIIVIQQNIEFQAWIKMVDNAMNSFLNSKQSNSNKNTLYKELNNLIKRYNDYFAHCDKKHLATINFETAKNIMSTLTKSAEQILANNVGDQTINKLILTFFITFDCDIFKKSSFLSKEVMAELKQTENPPLTPIKFTPINNTW